MKSRLASALVVLVWSIVPAQAIDAPAAVDSARMSNADGDAASWLSYGRTYSEQRFMIKRANEDRVSGVK